MNDPAPRGKDELLEFAKLVSETAMRIIIRLERENVRLRLELEKTKSKD